MTNWQLTIWVVLLLNLSGAAEQDVAKEEMKKLEGAWSVVFAEQAGERLSEEKTKALNVQVVFRGSTVTARVGEQTREATYRIDPTKKPAAIDTTDRNNRVEEGIYLLEGDTLKLCTAEAGGQRPTEFMTRAGTDHRLFVLRRVKP